MANDVMAEGTRKRKADLYFCRLVKAIVRKLGMAENDASLPNAPERHHGIREEIDAAFASIRGLVKASFRPLPTQTGDGSYIEAPVSSGVIKDLQKLGVSDVETLIELVQTSISGQPTNDRTYFMERLIKIASELPLSSKNGTKLTDGLVGGLWADLQHPPSSYLGEKHMYRTADGSFNVHVTTWSDEEFTDARSEPYATPDRSSRYAVCQKCSAANRSTCISSGARGSVR